MAEAAKKSVTVAKPPRIIKVGTKTVVTGGWRVADVLVHLIEHQALEGRWERLKARHGITEQPGEVHGKDPRWCWLGCMASRMFQRDSLTNRERVRARVSNLFYALLEKDKLLLIAYEPGGRGRIEALKLFHPRLKGDQQHLEVRWERMKRRLDLAEEHVEAVARLREGSR